MNRHLILGNYQQLFGKAVQVWGRITRDPFSVMAGRHKEQIGSMRERVTV